jgi:hypothetical protein
MAEERLDLFRQLRFTRWRAAVMVALSDSAVR